MVRVTGGVLLLFPSVIGRPAVWWLTAAAMALGLVPNWATVDNHKYLMLYWTTACALACYQASPSKYLAEVARLLVAGVFCLATFWKLLAGEYLDGSFLYWTFIEDHRLHRLAGVLGTQSLEVLRSSVEARNVLGAVGMAGVALPVLRDDALIATSIALSWVTLAVEGIVGLLHAIPAERLYALRHAALIGFIVASYPLLPVAGFAFVLAILGYAQCRPGDRVRQLMYIALFCWAQMSLLPWQRVFVPADGT